MDDPLFALTLVTALGCGLSGGALFAFSSFVMQALALLVKRKDGEADARRNPVNTQTESVLSGKTIEKVREEAE